MHKDVAWIIVKRGDIFQIARVGQLIQTDDGFVVLCAPIENKIRADKAGTAGY